MVVKNHFSVRRSAIAEGYYIDYLGNYSIKALSDALSLDESLIKSVFDKYSFEYHEDMGVYYFNSSDKANEAISILVAGVPANKRGRAVYLTDNEIELIRKALINEDSNLLTVKKSYRDNIFKKLNNTY